MNIKSNYMKRIKQMFHYMPQKKNQTSKTTKSEINLIDADSS